MRPKFVAVAALAFAVTVGQAQADQLECFRVKDAQQKARLAPVAHGMTLPVGCTIKVAAKLVCAAPDSAEDADGVLVCSEVKCDAGTAPPSPIVDEVLGEVKARRSRIVCTRVTVDDTVDTTTTTLAPDGVATTTASSTTTTTVSAATTTTSAPPFPTCDAPNASCGSCGNGACQPTRPEGRFVCTFQTQGFCQGSCETHADCADGKACIGASGEFGQCCTPCF